MQNTITKKGNHKTPKLKHVSRNVRLAGEFLDKEIKLLDYLGLDSPALYRMLITEKYREVFETE